MQFSLTIEMDNAAFEDDPAGELARVLHTTAERVGGGDDPDGLRRSGAVHDVNGNRVGEWMVTA